jgi:hypothetical protein
MLFKRGLSGTDTHVSGDDQIDVLDDVHPRPRPRLEAVPPEGLRALLANWAVSRWDSTCGQVIGYSPKFVLRPVITAGCELGQRKFVLAYRDT